jgi:hypothetical protein
MSAVSSTTSSGESYAVQLAKSSALKRSLVNIGNAVQNGDMTTANTLITKFVKDNPQYAASSTSSSQSQDPLTTDFQTLAAAVSNNQVSAARSAWKQVTTDLSKDGVNLQSNNAQATAEVVAQSKASMDQEIISTIFGSSSSSDTSSLASLLSGSTDSSSTTGSSSSLLSSWVTYQETGSTTSSSTSSTLGSILNTSA